MEKRANGEALISLMAEHDFESITVTTIRERILEDGTTVLDFIPVAGRKG